MDSYGLTEAEKQMNLHAYNHALFDNMKVFMDACWEINLVTDTVVMIHDAMFQEHVGKQYAYAMVYEDYGRKNVYVDDQACWRENFSREALTKLREEKLVDIRLIGESGEPENCHMVMTPAFDEDKKTVLRVYVSIKNAKVNVTLIHKVDEEKQAIFTAITQLYNCILYVNLTKNTCIIYNNESPDMGAPTENSYDTVFGTMMASILEEYRTEFSGSFSRERQMERMLQPGQTLQMELQQQYPDGTHWGCVQSVRIQEAGSADVIVIMMVSIIDEKKEKELQQLEMEQQDRQMMEDLSVQLKHYLSQEEQYRQAIISGAVLVYNINVTQNVIEEEFYEMIEGVSIPMIKSVGMQAPCNFDAFSRAWADKNIPESERDSYIRIFNRDYLLSCYRKGNVEITHEYQTREGRDIYVTLRHTILLTEDKLTGDIIALCNAKDISAQRAKEQETMRVLREAVEVANRASNAKSDFLSRMSHDIRTPLNAIIGMTAIAELHLEDRKKMQDCLEKIDLSSKHLLALVNDILEMSKIESGNIDLNESELNLADLFDSLLEMGRPLVESKNHELKVEIRQVEHEHVIGDSLRIQQIFMNLLDNAVKYTPSGGRISLTISEKKSDRYETGYYEFIFEDNGIGMSPTYVKTIFEPFSRELDTRINDVQGIGLGLSIAKNIASMMGGDIKVESKMGYGSRFIVTLYLKLQEEEKYHQNLRALPVLVVDDDKEACDSACAALEELGMKTACAYSGKDAVELAKAAHEEQKDFFVAIIDWQMPEVDGIETAKMLRKEVGDEVYIVIVSNYDWSDIELEARSAGADAFINKPLFKSKLARLLQTFAGEERREEEPLLEQLKEADFSGHHILVAEDNELNAEIIIEILEMVGLTVERVVNGREAVERVASSSPDTYDLIFMDIQMPVMNGIEATRAIRELSAEGRGGMPIIAMTAHAFDDDIRAVLNAGMNEHIAKPIDIEKLIKALRHWLPG